MPRPPFERRWRAALPWLAGAIAAFMAVRNMIGSRGDFDIYLDAARELAAGGQDLYRARDTAPYPYPHAVLLPLCALRWLLPDAVIRIGWALGLGFATKVLLGDLVAIMRAFGGLRPLQWLTFGVLFQRCIAQNLTHGQLSLWIGVLLMRGTRQLLEGREWRAGAVIGLAGAGKLTPLAYLVALPCMRRWRTALALAGTAAVVVALLPWPFLGAEHWRYLHDFYRAMLAPLFDRGGQFLVTRHHGPSIAGTFDYLLQPLPLDDQGRVIALLAVDDATLRLVKLGWSAVLAGLCGAGFLRAARLDEAMRLAVQSSLVMLAMAFFSPYTTTYHLVGALLPGALFCRGPARRDWLWWAAALLLLLSMTLRQKKLIGETLWRAFDDYNMLHVGLVLLLVWLVRWIWQATPPRVPGV